MVPARRGHAEAKHDLARNERMRNQTSWAMVEILAALIASEGVYWFVSGTSTTSTKARAVAVAIQITVAAGVAVYAEIRRRRVERTR